MRGGGRGITTHVTNISTDRHTTKSGGGECRTKPPGEGGGGRGGGGRGGGEEGGNLGPYSATWGIRDCYIQYTVLTFVFP